MEQQTNDTQKNVESIQKKSSSMGVVIALVVILVLVGLWALGKYTSIKVPGVSKSMEGQQVAMGLDENQVSPEALKREEGKWQAVFLTNGQVYFGHLRNPDSQYSTLEEVYYLQVQQQQIQQAAGTTEGEVSGVQQPAQPQLVLIKFGTELHRPEDFMKINRDHILFWEDMTTESTVVKSIVQYKEQQRQGNQPAPAPTQPAPVQPQQPAP